MEIRYVADAVRYPRMTAEELRKSYWISLFDPDKMTLVYSDVDRAIVGSAVPGKKPLKLSSAKELAAEYFAERREIGVINIGGMGCVEVDSRKFNMSRLDGLYIGRGSREIVFGSGNPKSPAKYYILSYPAHTAHPTTHIRIGDALPSSLGSQAEANARTIYKYIHPAGVKSCQLVMGFTRLEAGSVWNTMSAHTHERRTEVYCYFDIEDKHVVFHFMGSPGETRHIVMRNGEAVLSPSWSIHSGCGTKNYSFIWGMGGENQAFDDMDGVAMEKLK
jgi:4-deoxy-L-threo-5-hexosulose-uronate ketol-isomerase